MLVAQDRDLVPSVITPTCERPAVHAVAVRGGLVSLELEPDQDPAGGPGPLQRGLAG